MSSQGPVASRTLAVLLYATSFDATTLSAARRCVRQYSTMVGLAGQRLDDFVLAISEVLTNAAQHGGGTGRLELRAGMARLRCRVTDRGPGLPDGFAISRPVDPRARSGRGLWVVHAICDQVTWQSSPAGTSVDLAVALS